MRYAVWIALMGRLVTIAEATHFLWGNDNRSLRNRTRDFLKVNEVEMLRDGKQYFVRALDLKRLVGEVTDE
jgi:hypothetical protein